MKRKDFGTPASEPRVSRRDFLKAGGAGILAAGTISSGGRALASATDQPAVILLMLVGGPSQLETFDPKPDAPNDVRGPFGSIETTVPGIRVGAHLPGMAARMRTISLIRSLHHDAAPIHETGQQLIQTGRLCRHENESPHFGAVASRVLSSAGRPSPFALLPGPIGNTGVMIPHGQDAGPLGDAHAARTADGLPRTALDLSAESDARTRYGSTPFGDDCLRARRLVEAGVRVVTVNMYQTVFNKVSWDCHGAGPFSTLDDYARTVLPTFDRAFSALIDDLDRTGRLGSTMVIATGEFGRTPRLNASGGRDHWPAVWSAAVAGGPIGGGRVIGSSDATASEPRDQPVRPQDLVAAAYRHLGIDPTASIRLDSGERLALLDDADAGRILA